MSSVTTRPPPWPEELIAYQTRRPTAPIPSWIWWALAALLAVYFTFGLLWIAFAENVPWADADFYFRGAKSIADGNGYSHPFRSAHPPTAFHPVGFPWLLGHVWQLFGIDTANCDVSQWPQFPGCGAMIQTGQVINVTLATLNIGLVFALATLLKGPRLGLLSAVIYALIPSRFLFTSALMSEESFVALVMLALIALVLGVRRQDWAWFTAIGFGLALGSAAFIRPLGIVLLPLPLVLLLSKSISPRVALTHVLVGSAVAIAVLVPWELRNNREVGGWSLVSNNGGINLWIGCHQNSEGKLTSNGQWMDWWSGDAPDSLNTSDERANDAEAQRLALQCMREQPLQFVRLSLVKGLYTFREDWTYVSKWAFNNDLPESNSTSIVSAEVIDSLTYLTNGVYFVLLPLAVIGAITTLSAPSVYRGLLGASFLALALVPLLFFGEPRFHVPLFPIMSIWAAEGGWILVRALRTARETVDHAEHPQTARPVPSEWR